MLKKLLIINVLVMSLAHVSYAKDHGAGNGGDTIECSSASADIAQGVYFLDYLAALMDPSPDGYYQSLSEVVAFLNAKVPELGKALESISEAYESRSKTGKYVWKNFYPQEITDEEMTFIPPENCSVIPKQLVVRRSPNNNRAYFFASRDRMEQLKIQKSWIFVHELLWDYYDSAFDIRIVNEMIHSKSYRDQSSENFIEELYVSVKPQNFFTTSEYTFLEESEKYYQQAILNKEPTSKKFINEIFSRDELGFTSLKQVIRELNELYKKSNKNIEERVLVIRNLYESVLEKLIEEKNIEEVERVRRLQIITLEFYNIDFDLTKKISEIKEFKNTFSGTEEEKVEHLKRLYNEMDEMYSRIRELKKEYIELGGNEL